MKKLALLSVLAVVLCFAGPSGNTATGSTLPYIYPVLEPMIVEDYVQEPEPEVDDFIASVDIDEELLGWSVTAEEPIYTDPVPTMSLEGSGGAALTSVVQLLRIGPADYADGISSLAGPNRWSAREISNEVLTQSGSIPSDNNLTDMLWQWGQFIDHDVDLTEPGNTESEPIEVPLGDPFFDPLGQGNKTIPFSRSVYDPLTGTSIYNPRQQINEITGFIDASNVYGSDAIRAQTLRMMDGTGRLKESSGHFLPYNLYGLPNAGGANRTDLFLCGDVRCNEQVALTSMHNLWVREHNFWAVRLSNNRPSMTGDDRYEAARNVVMAEEQVITYQDFLPLLLGPNAIPAYTGYNPYIDARITNEFSTAAYRLGHTMLSATILRLNKYGTPIPQGPLALRDAFFAPTQLTSVGLDPYMKGLASQVMQQIDSKVVDDVRNFLFGAPGSGGLDLASLNIQRGRDHGLPDYNTMRIAYGLQPVGDFDQITSDTTVQNQLETAYGNVNDIDAWVGALAEDHKPGTVVGELLYAAIVDQFIRLRDGDPDWYENRLNSGAARSIENQTLAKVIARNTELLRSDLQANVFVLP
jgi:peroxidase